MKNKTDSIYKQIGIYGIKCLGNDKVYVGQTSMNFGDRRDTHFSLLNTNKHPIREMQEDWNNYGREKFEFFIIHELQSNDDIDKLEKQYIQQYGILGNIYNKLSGGRKGYTAPPMSEDTKRKIGEKNRQNMLGKKLPEEVKKKMSETHKKRLQNLTEEEKRKRVEKMVSKTRGVKWDEERRKKYSDMQKEKPNGSKYNIEIVREIRRLHEKENKSFTEISQIMNIPRPAVYNIATYRRWKYAV